MRLFSIAALFLSINLVLAIDWKCVFKGPSYWIDGCSIPFGLPFSYKKTFRRACNLHDVCYNCAHYHGISRKSCDRRFLRHMIHVCRKRFKFLRRWHCIKRSRIYFYAVRAFGKKYFPKPSKKGCWKSWVYPCITQG